MKNALRSGIVGGLLLAIIEGMMIFYQQMQMRNELVEKNKQIEMHKREIMRMRGFGQSMDFFNVSLGEMSSGGKAGRGSEEVSRI